MDIVYAVENDLDAEEFLSVLERSGLAERRPVHDKQRIAKMVANTDLMVTARDTDGILVGVARSVTDFSYCCYISDLAVDATYQSQGIGRELVARTRVEAGMECTTLLISAPKAMDYYPKLGMERIDRCFAYLSAMPGLAR